jgi:hypothetical protein
MSVLALLGKLLDLVGQAVRPAPGTGARQPAPVPVRNRPAPRRRR